MPNPFLFSLAATSSAETPGGTTTSPGNPASDVIKVPAHRPAGLPGAFPPGHPLAGAGIPGLSPAAVPGGIPGFPPAGFSAADYANLLAYRPLPFPGAAAAAAGYLPGLHNNLLAARFGGKLKIFPIL